MGKAAPQSFWRRRVKRRVSVSVRRFLGENPPPPPWVGVCRWGSGPALTPVPPWATLPPLPAGRQPNRPPGASGTGKEPSCLPEDYLSSIHAPHSHAAPALGALPFLAWKSLLLPLFLKIQLGLQSVGR